MSTAPTNGRKLRYAPHNHRVRTDILDFVKTFTDTKGYSPSVKEIKDALVALSAADGVERVRSVAAVSTHVDALEQDGLVQRAWREDENGVRHSVSKSLRVTDAYLSGAASLRSPVSNPDGPNREPSRVAQVRAWARENNVPVSQRGRIAKTVYDQYDSAHP